MMYSIKLDKVNAAYFPGEEVKGRVHVEFSGDKPPDKIKVNLVWQTRGKGTVDSKVEALQEFSAAGIADGGRFTLPIPEQGPYSMSGRLLSISWRVEVELPKEDDPAAGVPIIVSANGKEVILNEIPRQVNVGSPIRNK